MDFIAASTVFLLIFLAELGDKTQLTVISLSSQLPPTHVFAGSLLGILVVDGLSIMFGASILAFVPLNWVMFASGCIFLLFGALTLRGGGAGDVKVNGRSRLPIVTSFYMMALGELGDKTQIASIALAAEVGVESALLGVMTAFLVLITLGVVLGASVLSRLPRRWVTLGSAAFFIVVGALSILSVLLGIRLI